MNLREVSLKILELEICRTAFDATIYGRGMNYAMLCAGRLSGGADTCAVRYDLKLEDSLH